MENPICGSRLSYADVHESSISWVEFDGTGVTADTEDDVVVVDVCKDEVSETDDVAVEEDELELEVELRPPIPIWVRYEAASRMIRKATTIRTIVLAGTDSRGWSPIWLLQEQRAGYTPTQENGLAAWVGRFCQAFAFIDHARTKSRQENDCASD